jgi:hypothetical protein
MQTSFPPEPAEGAVLGTGAHPDDYPRAALVTGAALRLGRAIALDLADAGWSVVLHHRNSETAARALEAEIGERGGTAVALKADLAQEDQAAGLISRAVDAVGPLGLLVNNASVFEPDLPSDATRESWDLHMETNLRAPFVLTQAFAAALPSGAGGLVANLLDDRVLALPGDYISYSLSKAGLPRSASSGSAPATACRRAARPRPPFAPPSNVCRWPAARHRRISAWHFVSSLPANRSPAR